MKTLLAVFGFVSESDTCANPLKAKHLRNSPLLLSNPDSSRGTLRMRFAAAKDRRETSQNS
jgi:hypothetical protein